MQINNNRAIKNQCREHHNKSNDCKMFLNVILVTITTNWYIIFTYISFCMINLKTRYDA